MANLRIRDLDEKTIIRLTARAARNGRSLEEEIKAILEEHVGLNATQEQPGKQSRAEFAAEADRIRSHLAATGKVFGDSAEEIRADRDDPDR